MRAPRLIAALLACIVVPLAIVGIVAQRYEKFSPIDEAAHFDYLRRSMSFDVPIMGDEMAQETNDIVACTGVDLPGLVLPRCGSKAVKAENFPGGGLSYEAQQPPLYYWTTAPLAWVVEKVAGLGPLGSARAIGGLWLALACVALYLTGMALKVNRGLLLALLLFVVASPVVAYHNSIVSNDAAVLCAASFLVMVAARVHTERKSLIGLCFGVSFAAGMIKTSLVITAGCLAVVLLLGVLAEGTWREKSLKQLLRVPYVGSALSMGSGALLAAFLWNTFTRLTATMPLETFPVFDVLRGQDVGYQSIAREALVFFGTLTDSYTPFVSWNPNVHQMLAVLGKVFIIGFGTAGLFASGRSWWRVSAPVALVGGYLGTFAVGVGIWRTYDMTPGLVSRYGLPVVPILLLAAAGGIRGRVQVAIASGLFGFAGLMFLWIIVRAPMP